MSITTSRDQVWKQALEQARMHGKFKASAIDADCTGRTVRNTLAAMEELNLLARENPQSGIWYAGPRLLHTMDVTEKALKIGITESDGE